jgi:hypothetical protein
VSSTSPFGQYAAVVAALAALGILGAWIATAIGLGGLHPAPELNAAALIVLGAIFGTGAGALVVANGVGKQAAVANTRLDAIDAPSAPAAAAIAEHKAADAAAAPHPPPTASGGVG